MIFLLLYNSVQYYFCSLHTEQIESNSLDVTVVNININKIDQT